MDFVQESFAIAPVRAAPSERLARLLTRLALCQQINCDQHQQKIRNEDRGACIIFRDSLPKKQRSDCNCGNDCATERDGRISCDKYEHGAKRAQHAGSELDDCDGSHQCGTSSRQWTIGQMALYAFKVSSAIDDLINT